MSLAKQNDTVRIHFTAKTKDKVVVASSGDGDPLEIVIGGEKFVPGLKKLETPPEAPMTQGISIDRESLPRNLLFR